MRSLMCLTFIMTFIVTTFMPLAATAAEKEYYAKGRFNIRNGPGTNRRVIRTLKRNESMEYVSRRGNWYKVRAESSGVTGWVHKSGVGSRTASNKEDCEDCLVKKKENDENLEKNSENIDEVSSAMAEQLEKPSKFAPVFKKPSKFPDDKPSKNPPSSGKVAKLMEAAKAEAARCRSTASHVRRRTGKSTMCGIGVSKGMCYQAVKQALQKADVLDYYLPGGSAYQAHTQGHLKRAGMTNVKGQYNEYSAPAGAILVYKGGGHGHGHIEIKGGKNLYCSDYCSARPVRNRQLIAVYVFQ